MFKRFWQWLLARYAIEGDAGYERGKKNAEAFMLTNPTDEMLQRHWVASDPPSDDYDRGYLDVLMKKRPDFHMMEHC